MYKGGEISRYDKYRNVLVIYLILIVLVGLEIPLPTPPQNLENLVWGLDNNKSRPPRIIELLDLCRERSHCSCPVKISIRPMIFASYFLTEAGNSSIRC